MSRQAFEAFITAPPFEMGISRIDDRGAWPGSYRSYAVHLAWQAYKAATNAALELAAKPQEWRAMVYAPLDGTKITLLIRHKTWWTAHKCDPASAPIWEAESEGHWIDYNGGGWTWAGMAGTPIGWRALKDETE